MRIVGVSITVSCCPHTTELKGATSRLIAYRNGARLVAPQPRCHRNLLRWSLLSALPSSTSGPVNVLSEQSSHLSMLSRTESSADMRILRTAGELHSSLLTAMTGTLGAYRGGDTDWPRIRIQSELIVLSHSPPSTSGRERKFCTRGARGRISAML